VGTLQGQLNTKANVTIWNQGVFALNASSVDSLIDGLKNSDFGVFVLSPDDIRTIREETLEVASRACQKCCLNCLGELKAE
jgi:predicted nucleotide-binding protein